MAEVPPIKVRLIPEGVEDVIASIGKVTGEVGKLTAAVGGAGAALFAFTKRAADIVDELGKMSQKVGVTVETLSALKFAAELSDISLDSLGTGLRMLSRNMVETQQGTGDARDGFRALGISVEEMPGKLKPTETVLMELADRFQKMKDGPEKTALAMRLFGRAGADLIPLLNQGRAGIEALRKEAERLGVVFSTEAAKAAEEFNDNMTRLKASATGLSVHMAGPFVKAFGEAAAAFLKAKTEGEGFFSAMQQGIVQLTAGSDRQRWEREMANAGEALIQAQDKLDRANRAARMGGAGRLGKANVERAKQEVAAAKAEVERLRAIGPILAPEVVPPEAPEQEAAPEVETEKQRRERLERYNAMVSEEEAIRDGAFKAEIDAMNKQGAEMAKKRLLANALNITLLEDLSEEEREIESMKYLDLGIAFQEYSAEQLEAIKAAQDLRNQILIEGYDAEQAMALEHGQALLEIAKHTTDEEVRILGMSMQQRAGLVASGFADMTAAVARGSRFMFNLNKAATIANVALTLPEKISDAYKWGNKIGGPILGGAFAAVAGAAGLAHIQMAQRASFSGAGGGVAPSAVATPAAPVSPVGGGNSRGGGTTIIQFQGSGSEEKLLRRFVDALNNGSENGNRILLT